MKYLEKGEELLSRIADEFTLLSSQVKGINLYSNEVGVLVGEILFELLYSKKEKKLKLILTDIREFSFFYTSDYDFYNIERYKLMKIDNGYYISLDPFDESEEISADDQDFIKCQNIEGYVS